MLGAIFGDMVGSVYEFNNTKRVDFPLLSKWSHPTDDTMMTLAVARALMNTWGRSDDEIRAGLVRSMQHLGRRYPNAGYAMTMNNKFDVCVRYFLSTGRYNIVADNMILHENEMPLLGAKA